jgi:hypothetical protein
MSPERFEEYDDLGIESFDEVYQKKYGAKDEEETLLETTARTTARTGARAAETLLGLPGDVKDLLSNILVGIPEYFAGEELPRWRQAVKGDQSDFPEPLGLNFPTSSELREGITKPLTGEYLEPKNEFEKFGDTISEDFASLAIPVKGKIPFARALGSSILANSGAEVAKVFGGDKAEAYTKMGLLFSSGLLGQKGGGIKQYIRNLYKDMETSVPKGAVVSAVPLEKKLNKIENILKKGDPKDLSKAPGIQKIRAIKDKIQSGQIDVDEVIELTKSTNESIFGLGELKRGQNQLYNIRQALHDTVNEYGSSNREFLGKWKAANEAYAATETSRNVSNWIKKNISPKDYLYAGSALGLGGMALGVGGMLTSLPITAKALGSGAALASTAYSAAIINRISKSPALRKYYTNVVKNSLKQNKGGFLRAMKQLDNGIKESLEKSPYETVDFED